MHASVKNCITLSSEEFCQAWCCDHLTGEPVPVPKNLPGEEPFPDVPLELPLKQLHSISLCSDTGGQRDGQHLLICCPLALRMCDFRWSYFGQIKSQCFVLLLVGCFLGYFLI